MKEETHANRHLNKSGRIRLVNGNENDGFQVGNYPIHEREPVPKHSMNNYIRTD